MKITDVTPGNVMQETLFCIKNVKARGFQDKKSWFEKRHKEGLKLKILKNDEGGMEAFIEYIPVEMAWRPIQGKNMYFIHCLYVYSKESRRQGLGTKLLETCEKDAREKGMQGICTMTSRGAWLADERLFLNNGYQVFEEKGRFLLVGKIWDKEASPPVLRDWEKNAAGLKGWHLVYADQCPWHEKAVTAILEEAMDRGLDIKVKHLRTAAEAQQAPSGFGVFSLVRDGRLLEDHYISKTRFRNILKKELNH